MGDFVDLRGNFYSDTDREFDKKLRPLRFNDFHGQKKIVNNLKVFVKAA